MAANVVLFLLNEIKNEANVTVSESAVYERVVACEILGNFLKFYSGGGVILKTPR